MNNKPWAYVTSAWSADRSRAKRSAKRYCRKLYEAGYTPICPLLSLPEVIDTSNADEYKDYMDISEDMLRRSRYSNSQPLSCSFIHYEGCPRCG